MLVKDKNFKPFVTEAELHEIADRLAGEISRDYREKDLVACPILTGAFMFASELFKRLTIPCEISFVKLTSYSGTKSTNVIRELIGLDHSIEGRHVVIVEDIVDTGHTMKYTIKKLKDLKAADVRIASLFFKPENFQYDYPINYIGMEIGNDFIVGYGLDYDQQGRNLPDIYKIIE